MKRPASLAAWLLGVADRLMPSLLMAMSVTLLAAGLLWYGSPDATGSDLGTDRPVAVGSADLPSDPGSLPGSSPRLIASASPGPSFPTPGDPTPTAPSPRVSSAPGSLSPAPTAAELAAVATRVVIPAESIDLPVVSRDLRVPGQGPDQYPPCDVAIFHTAFVQPGEAGTTYLYAHARDGMFLPLLQASERHDGHELLGAVVEVYTDDDRRYVYEVTQVKRHATDFSLADDVAPGVSQLILQTSEGPRGTEGKLQVLAELQDVLDATRGESHPRARPRACYDTP
ncbi:MAG: hypothetical protein QOH61_1347 [Chloroflexota bacterium]|jgi:hypothetical protein|nr:hypothetical protein [Chloroflexota bacterium]